MSIAIAIIGLGFLVLVHEAGHFFASLAVGLRPRKFYVGFPPAAYRYHRNGIEYGVGVIPLGGFVTIPGMHRPIAHDAEKRFSRAVSEAPGLAGPVDRVRRALEGADPHDALGPLDDVEALLRDKELTPDARASAERGLTELRDALGPDAYWKAATWRRLVAIAAGPVANIVLALVLLTILFTRVGGDPSRTVAAVTSDYPAARAGVQAGDRIVAVDGEPVDGVELGDRILESGGRPLELTVVRDGEEVRISVTPRKTSDGYRLGIVREGTGLPLANATGRAFDVSWVVTVETVKALGRLAIGQGRQEIRSPIGIVQASSDSVQQGAEDYLWVLSLISLSLALLNLLPFLPLDGGHILFSIVEGARGRLVRREVYERVSVVGLAIVLLLFFIGLTNDIGNLS